MVIKESPKNCLLCEAHGRGASFYRKDTQRHIKTNQKAQRHVRMLQRNTKTLKMLATWRITIFDKICTKTLSYPSLFNGHPQRHFSTILDPTSFIRSCPSVRLLMSITINQLHLLKMSCLKCYKECREAGPKSKRGGGGGGGKHSRSRKYYSHNCGIQGCREESAECFRCWEWFINYGCDGLTESEGEVSRRFVSVLSLIN